MVRTLKAVVLLLGLSIPAACDATERAAQRWAEEQGTVAQSWSADTHETVMGVPAAAAREAIERRLGRARPPEADPSDWRRVRNLYDTYGGVPLWFDEEGLADRAAALTNALSHAPAEALALSAYPIEDLRGAVEAVRGASRPTADQIAEADVLLSTMYVTLATDMFRGQVDPRAVSQGWHVDARESDLDSAIARTIRSEPLDRAIAAMRPQAEDFDDLRDALRRYRDIVARGGWAAVAEGEVLEPGDTSTVARLEGLRDRLLMERFIGRLSPISALPDTVDEDAPDTSRAPRALYDDALAGAVGRYQARHGLVVDSILGPNTLSALNAPAEYRLRQIAANMERYRWLPRVLGDRYVFVNVPAFRLSAFENGEPVLDMKVIVGAEYNDRATPAFSDSMSYVVFQPYWNIPENIALEEILPASGGRSSYMRDRNYEVVQASGEARVLGQYVPSASAIRSGEVRIRERPNPGNALGLVKFMFPNDFAIYLHDTPAGELFEEDVRAFSHGCIRVEDPVALAEFVLGWDEQRIRDAMTSGPRSERVNLDRKLPVYILYLTTYVRDGELWFGNDLYDRDRALTQVVAGAAMPETRLVREVEELHRLVSR